MLTSLRITVLLCSRNHRSLFESYTPLTSLHNLSINQFAIVKLLLISDLKTNCLSVTYHLRQCTVVGRTIFSSLLNILEGELFLIYDHFDKK